MVPLGGGEVCDALMGPILVVVGLEPIQELLQVGEVPGRSLVGEPLLQGLVEALELAQGLGVIGPGVDEGHPQGADPPLEVHHHHSVQAPGEAQAVEFLTDVKPPRRP